MNIIVIVPSLQEKGPVIIAENLAKFSINKSINYTFISLKNNSIQDKERFNKNKINFIEIGMKKLPSIEGIVKMKEIIAALKPEVIHVHSFWPTILASKYLSEYKVMATLHSNPEEDLIFEYGKIIGKIMLRFTIRALSKFDKIIAISSYVEHCHIKLGVNPNYISVIYNGIEDKFNSNIISKKDDILKIISISVLNKGKNIFKSLDIIKSLIEKGSEVEYKIIGDGAERERIERYIRKLDLVNIVKLEGKVSRERVFKLLSESDVLMFTTLTEGFGLVVAESMMMGKPVVVSDIPVMKEIVDHQKDGIIANSNSEFIEAIEFLSKKDNFEKLSVNARNKYMEKFRINNMCHEYESEYQKLALGNQK